MGLIEEESAAIGRVRAAREARRAAWLDRRNFYSSAAWRRLRYEVLKERGRRCEVCGRSPPEVTLDVDHIKPRSKFPELALVKSNLQVMCADDNRGKGNRDSIDWRRS